MIDARHRSVVARALARHRVSTWLLLALPVLVGAAGCEVMTCFDAGAFAIVLTVVATDLLALAALFVVDVCALASAVRAERRRARGLPPVRPGVDYGVGSEVWAACVARADDPYRAQDRWEPAAMGSPRLAVRAIVKSLQRRGLLVALVGSATLFVCGVESLGTCRCSGSDRGSASTAAYTIRSATILYENGHGGRCPTVADLKAQGLVDEGLPERDPWDNPFQILCRPDEITVASWGPDRNPYTADDVIVPPPIDASVQPP